MPTTNIIKQHCISSQNDYCNCYRRKYFWVSAFIYYEKILHTIFWSSQ